jgi:hypothetical protein
LLVWGPSLWSGQWEHVMSGSLDGFFNR